MAPTVGRVSVGFISIELQAVTGEVDGHPGGSWRVSTADGQNIDLTYEQGLFERAPKLGPPLKRGDQVSVFWGRRTGKMVRIIAIVNHTQERFGFIPQPFNNMIIPGTGNSTRSPLYNFLAIVAITITIVSVLGLFMGNPQLIVLLPLPIGFYLWIRKRQKKLRKAIETAAAKLKPRAAAARAGEAPGLAAIRI